MKRLILFSLIALSAAAAQASSYERKLRVYYCSDKQAYGVLVDIHSGYGTTVRTASAFCKLGLVKGYEGFFYVDPAPKNAGLEKACRDDVAPATRGCYEEFLKKNEILEKENGHTFTTLRDSIEHGGTPAVETPKGLHTPPALH